ncbi:hypothetical protein Smic_00760 [Streptomyces microflavus]|uniref:Uncharacterized protein n=1 Tax=Streptomyces microflavus TaxID=1919 RepID=A0A7J0CG96_STRMI|nr:hypothetical protein Smic_00760 [Streptomyces microflavus]
MVDRFLTSWLSRWPELRCASGEDESDGVFSPWIPGGTGTSNGRGALLIARDEGMEASWDTTGYTLDEHGDGPPALFYEAAGRRSLSMTPQGSVRPRRLPVRAVRHHGRGGGAASLHPGHPDDSTFIRAAPDTLLLAAGTSLPGR